MYKKCTTTLMYLLYDNRNIVVRGTGGGVRATVLQ